MNANEVLQHIILGAVVFMIGSVLLSALITIVSFLIMLMFGVLAVLAGTLISMKLIQSVYDNRPNKNTSTERRQVSTKSRLQDIKERYKNGDISERQLEKVIDKELDRTENRRDKEFTKQKIF